MSLWSLLVGGMGLAVGLTVGLTIRDASGTELLSGEITMENVMEDPSAFANPFPRMTDVVEGELRRLGVLPKKPHVVAWIALGALGTLLGLLALSAGLAYLGRDST